MGDCKSVDGGDQCEFEIANEVLIEQLDAELKQRRRLLDELEKSRAVWRSRKASKRFAKWLRTQSFERSSDERFRLVLASWLEGG